MQKNTKNKNGFSFIEAIVSVFLLSVGMVAILSLISSGIKETLAAKDQQIGTLLAQEGVELVRNVRDNNWASENLSGTFARFPDSNVYNRSISFAAANMQEDQFPLYIRTTNANGFRGFYFQYDTGNVTKFKRKLFIVYNTGSRATAETAEITSIVWWGTDLNLNEFTGLNSCTTANKCAYVKVTLSKWGE